MSFITVKYGANEERLANPNCLCSVLLHHIKRSCGFEHIIENVDLASETGEVVDLVSKPKEYARKYLEGRANYILVKVIGDESEDSSPTYVSLLEQTGEKIKFSVLNPTQRQRNKGKAGKGDQPSRYLGSGGDGENEPTTGTRATTGTGAGGEGGRAGRRGNPPIKERTKTGDMSTFSSTQSINELPGVNVKRVGKAGGDKGARNPSAGVKVKKGK
ncbi:hypothetical protein HDV00_000179 [Rhizophlyctis rosea]|nr:hypothetical protein HDV00_000179 [Rhizophlyctis rosea]